MQGNPVHECGVYKRGRYYNSEVVVDVDMPRAKEKQYYNRLPTLNLSEEGVLNLSSLKNPFLKKRGDIGLSVEALQEAT